MSTKAKESTRRRVAFLHSKGVRTTIRVCLLSHNLVSVRVRRPAPILNSGARLHLPLICGTSSIGRAICVENGCYKYKSLVGNDEKCPNPSVGKNNEGCKVSQASCI